MAHIFSSINSYGQTVWQRYPQNPVIPAWAGGDYALSPSVIFDSTSGLYRMWFTSKKGGAPWTISHAMSLDGTDWYLSMSNPVVLTGGSGTFESGGVCHANTIRVGQEYRMYCSGADQSGVLAIGLAKSQNGIHWSKYSGNPILTRAPGGFESVYVVWPHVHFDGSVYKMLYAGYNGSTLAVGLATSTDGDHLTKYPSNPVLQQGPPGSWDQAAVLLSSLTRHQGIYSLFYEPQDPAATTIGFATSINCTT